MKFVCGARTFLTLEEATNDKVVINDGGHDVNFKVMGSNLDHLFFTDGGNDRVGINTGSPTQLFDISNVLTFDGTDLNIHKDANNADVSLSLGTSAAESLTIEVLNGGSNKTAEEVHFSTATASSTADHGKMVFDVDGTDILTIGDIGLTLAGNLHTSVHDYGTTANIDVDFDQDALQKVLLNGAPAIDTAAANKGAGKSIVIKILCDSSARAFTWNSSWVFIGEKPTSIAASKTALLSMTCFGTNETDVVCSYAVQD
jgi:hypothetical protein